VWIGNRRHRGNVPDIGDLSGRGVFSRSILSELRKAAVELAAIAIVMAESWRSR
jgi:hypothetical protein